MNTDKLHQILIGAARKDLPSDRVPFAFEKRIMARIMAQPAVDPIAVWGQLLWRAAAPCVGLMLLMSAWTAFSPPQSKPSEYYLAGDLESAVLAPLAQLEDSW